MDIKQHLTERHCHTGYIADEKNCVATFWLWNLSGKIVGYQRYSPLLDKVKGNTGKYFTYVVKPNIGVWGLHNYNPCDTLFFCEGIFDACRFTHNGIAMLTKTPNHDMSTWIRSLPNRKILIKDSDDHQTKFDRYFNANFRVPVGDLGDQSEQFVVELVSNFT